jgi:hypothetical protein
MRVMSESHPLQNNDKPRDEQEVTEETEKNTVVCFCFLFCFLCYLLLIVFL